MIETMSLQEMRDYKGRLDVPDDFDRFWEKQLSSVSGLPKFERQEKDFSTDFARCSELYFEGTKKSSVYAKCIFPKKTGKVPVIFCFHGYQGQSPDWSECFKYTAAGFGIICMDVRGQAGRSADYGHFNGNTVKGQIIRGVVDGPEHLFFKDVYLDAFQLIEIAASFDFTDETHFFSYGASQGGALSLAAAALNPRIRRCVAVYPFLSDFPRVLELGDHSEAYNELFRYFKYADPLHQTENEIMDTLSYIDVKNFAHRIKGEVRLVTGLADEVCPPSTQFAIYNRIYGNKKMTVLPEYGHESLNVKINDLVFNWLTQSQIEI